MIIRKDVAIMTENRIRELRKSHNMSQEALGAVINTDYSGALWATCPDFGSHHSGEWEPHIPVIQSHI